MESLSNFTYLADAAAVQLEFFTLSYHTGNPIFAEKVTESNRLAAIIDT
jgi:hypothetical protein